MERHCHYNRCCA